MWVMKRSFNESTCLRKLANGTGFVQAAVCNYTEEKYEHVINVFGNYIAFSSLKKTHIIY